MNDLISCPKCGQTPAIKKTSGAPPRLSKSGKISGFVSPTSVIECCGMRLKANHVIPGIDGFPTKVDDPDLEVAEMWNQYARSGSLFQ